MSIKDAGWWLLNIAFFSGRSVQCKVNELQVKEARKTFLGAREVLTLDVYGGRTEIIDFSRVELLTVSPPVPIRT